MATSGLPVIPPPPAGGPVHANPSCFDTAMVAPIDHMAVASRDTSTTVASPVFSRWKSAPMIPPAIVKAPMESPKAGPGGGGTNSGSFGAMADATPGRHQNESWSYEPLSASGPRSPLPVPRT